MDPLKTDWAAGESWPETVANDVAARLNMLTTSSVPVSAGADGVIGSIAYDSTHFYVCVATNTWVRATLATWP
jgi:hypothetical protein